MGADKIVRILSLVVVIVAVFAPAFEHWTLIITLLGLGVGWFVSQEADDERLRFMVATLVLFVANDALGSIPAIGEYLDAFLQNSSDLFNAAAIEVIFLAVVRKLTQ